MSLLKQVGRFTHAGASEIPSFDPSTNRAFVVNGGTNVDILDLSNPASPLLITTISGATLGGAPNGVAVKNGVVAIAVENTNKQMPGFVKFFDPNGNLLHTVTVGALPDMITFSPDGKKVLTANEGEPSGYGGGFTDPEGSISILTVPGNAVISSANVATATALTAGFTAFNGQIDALRTSGVRIFGPGSTVAQDLEPEYITVSSDSSTAYVTLQEANALATVNLNTGVVTAVTPLGFKNHNILGNGIDGSDRDGAGNTPAINIANYPVFGMYQPDALASYQSGGVTYLITANEGDARDYPGLVEEVRVSATTLDPTAFPNGAALKTNAQIGRLTVTNQTGRTNSGSDRLGTDADPDYEKLFVFGSRSFSIWTTNGTLVYDSGDDFEQITSALTPARFNLNNGLISNFDTRSDNKGPEPEGVVVGQVNNRTYAFIGLERAGGIMVYDVTNPRSPSFVQHLVSPTVAGKDVDIAPEGITFVTAADSPNGKALLIVSHEVSKTTVVYEVAPSPDVSTQPPTSIPSGNGRLLLGNNLSEIILGSEFNDTIYSYAGNDTVIGAEGSDYIDGGIGNDYLSGGNGNDSMIGGAGDDTIAGNKGTDLLVGGAGLDRFVYTALSDSPSSGRDSISDFTQIQDKIVLTGLGFTNIQAGAGAGSILGYTTIAGVTTIANAANTFAINLNGTVPLIAGDFIF